MSGIANLRIKLKSAWKRRNLHRLTRRELIEHCKELGGYVHYLLEEGKLYDGDGFYTFPDGDTWERPGG